MSDEMPKRHHIGVQPIDDRARLSARTTIRCADRHGLAGLLFPILRKFRVEIGIEFTRRIIADIEQRGVGHGLRDKRPFEPATSLASSATAPNNIFTHGLFPEKWCHLWFERVQSAKSLVATYVRSALCFDNKEHAAYCQNKSVVYTADVIDGYKTDIVLCL